MYSSLVWLLIATHPLCYWIMQAGRWLTLFQYRVSCFLKAAGINHSFPLCLLSSCAIITCIYTHTPEVKVVYMWAEIHSNHKQNVSNRSLNAVSHLYCSECSVQTMCAVIDVCLSVDCTSKWIKVTDVYLSTGFFPPDYFCSRLPFYTSSRTEIWIPFTFCVRKYTIMSHVVVVRIFPFCKTG